MQKPDIQKREHLTMRVTRQMRDRIEVAAERSGRSLSQEIELRLEHSFRADESLGGPEQADLLRRVALIMDAASSVLGEAWWRRHVAWRLVQDASEFLLQTCEPARSVPVPQALSPEGQAELQRWEQEASVEDREVFYLHREQEQLEFRKRVTGLHPHDEARLRELKKRTRNKKPQVPRLSSKDMKAWLAHEEDREWGSSMFDAIEPILRAALAAQHHWPRIRVARS